MIVVQAVFVAAQTAVAFIVFYLLLLALAAGAGELKRRRRHIALPNEPTTKFAVLVPAYNEEVMIASLLDSLAAVDYPQHLVDVHVVADNCTDRTAEITRSNGVACHERFDDTRRSKGHALHWVIERLLESGSDHDAFVFFDADAQVDPSFLRVMDRELATQSTPLQGYYGVTNAGESWLTAVSTLGFLMQQYVKPLGRLTLGLPTRLLGNGMCLPADVVREYKWGSYSISEDLDFYMSLLLQGHRTRFVPDAVCRAVLPPRLAGAKSQRVRWEKGKVVAFKRYFRSLVSSGVRGRDWGYIDGAIDLASPPFTTLALIALLLGAAAWAAAPLREAFVPWLWLAVMLGILGYVAIGAIVTRQPLGLLAKSFVLAPYFIVWKLWVLVLAIVQLNDRTWVRTAR